MKKQTIILGYFCLMVVSATGCEKSRSGESDDLIPSSKTKDFEFNDLHF